MTDSERGEKAEKMKIGDEDEGGAICPSAIGNRFSIDAFAWRFLRKGLDFGLPRNLASRSPGMKKARRMKFRGLFLRNATLNFNESVHARTWGEHPLFREAPPPVAREDGKRVREGVLHFQCQGEDVSLRAKNL